MSSRRSLRYQADDYRPPVLRTDDLPLFQTAGPAAETEQRSLHDERFHAWLRTPDGQRAWCWMEHEALARAQEGRVSAKGLVEDCRRALRAPRVQINNVWTPLIARALMERHAALRDRFELRERRAGSL